MSPGHPPFDWVDRQRERPVSWLRGRRPGLWPDEAISKRVGFEYRLQEDSGHVSYLIELFVCLALVLLWTNFNFCSLICFYINFIPAWSQTWCRATSPSLWKTLRTSLSPSSTRWAGRSTKRRGSTVRWRTTTGPKKLTSARRRNWSSWPRWRSGRTWVVSFGTKGSRLLRQLQVQLLFRSRKRSSRRWRWKRRLKQLKIIDDGRISYAYLNRLTLLLLSLMQ